MEKPSNMATVHVSREHVSGTLTHNETSILHAIEHAAHFLPAQGPITEFVHHNTLHFVEDLPWEKAVIRGSMLYGCQPYLTEKRYRDYLNQGRIRFQDLREVLQESLGENGAVRPISLATRFELRLAMLEGTLHQGPLHELRWYVAETDALRRFRQDAPPAIRARLIRETQHWVLRDVLNNHAEDTAASGTGPRQAHVRPAILELLKHYDIRNIERWTEATWEEFTLRALWRLCRQGAHGVKISRRASERVSRHRDLLLEATGEDSDILVNELLIRFSAAYLDQGMASCMLPNREHGFWKAFCAVYGTRGLMPDAWLRNLPGELQRIQDARISSLACIDESLDLLGVDRAEREEYILDTLLALRGWAGMIRQIEMRGDRAVRPIPTGSLVEYLAVRLILDRLALAHIARQELSFRGSLHELRGVARSRIQRSEASRLEQRSFSLFELAQISGFTPPELAQLEREEWIALVQEIEEFPSIERRKVFHYAYERLYRNQTLDALAARSIPVRASTRRARFQIVCCIDDREESFRRHLEEVAPDCETLGAAGFFGVAMFYRGALDAHFTPLCPVVVTPRHYVTEEVIPEKFSKHTSRTRTRRAFGTTSHSLHVGSRGFLGGLAVSASVGVLAFIPLVARVLFPRLTARLRRVADQWILPPDCTRVRIEREADPPSQDHNHIGYTVPEMGAVVERLLRDIGMTDNLARVVVMCGHGSSSLNNPHRSAYDCGACAGARGGPNARVFSQMANDTRVRKELAKRGISIPEDTIFLGAFHNTCDDSVTFFDTDRLPSTHLADVERLRGDILLARQRNAHERCRRFESASLRMPTDRSLQHVEARGEDLSQPRPECGHATNASCIVGRRSRTRGLFMDRRAFLVSYDPEKDDETSTVLARILSAVVPVCAGINLEYYFSYTDTYGWGCGTKLPHNVASLLGVMDGAASDLRPGLPWQMVEIHEPMRLLLAIETEIPVMEQILRENPGIAQVIENDWVQLALVSPTSSGMHVYRNGEFIPYRPEVTRLPEVLDSAHWYRGWRDHLGYAEVRDMPNIFESKFGGRT
jgi:uncharacterized protein YbcC (UPF0753/DUF2309 family)